MKINYLLGAMGVFALLGISACGDDDPPPKTGISFELESFETLESDGTLTSFHPDLGFTSSTGQEIEVSILLDRPLSETTVLQYTVSGTATRTNPAGNAVNDFMISDGLNTIVGTDKITIEKGATEASIIVTVFEDFAFEVDDEDSPIETVTLQLTNVTSGNAEIATQDETTISIEEDDFLVILDWDVGNNTRGDADLDLLVLFDGDIVRGSASTGNSLEGVNIPAPFPIGSYGLSYPYYSGTTELEFAAIMFTTAGLINGTEYITSPLVFTGNYTLENTNVWDDPEAEGYKSPPQIVQTMQKNGINYTNVSSITVPSSGSRMSSSNFKMERLSAKELNELKQKLRYPEISTNLSKLD